MKRKLIMILALSTTLTMLAACNNTNENRQAELENDLIITESASYVTESEAKQKTSVSEETHKESTTDTYAESTGSAPASPVEYADIEPALSEDETGELNADTEMPAPFEGESGELNAEFFSTVNSKLNYTSMQFIRLVGLDEYKSWLDNASSVTNEYTSIADLANLYSFIKHFNIPNDTIREILVDLRNGSEDDFSDEEIDLIISGDDEAVAEHFVADTAILKGSDIYSLRWVYFHSLEDYAAAGITATELEATLPMFDKLTLTNEARQAIEMKIASYAAVSEQYY